MVADFLIAGCGVPWVEYEASVEKDEEGNPAQISLQQAVLNHVPWKRFHWEPGKDWEDVDWVARDHYLTKKEVAEQFGREPDTEGRGGEKPGSDKYATCYRVTEIWYRPKRQIYVIGWDFDEPLEVRPDALNLEGFYPCPRPMMANVGSSELVPMPDHKFFASSYAYINRLTQRIHNITGQVKAAGFYDGQLTELAALQGVEDGTYLPVSNLAERLAATGVADFNKVIATLPLKEKVEVLRELQELLSVEKAKLDEMSGISDIVRGTTDPNETASAQQIKSNWASLRLARKTGEVSRCLRDVFRIMAEIMAEHFTPQTLYLMSGMQPDPQVLQFIKSDIGRALAIDVETDSTVAMEDEAEKAQRIEFLNYVTPFLEKLLPAIQQGMLPADLGKALLLFAVRSFKHGRALEDAIEASPDTMAQLGQLQQQLQQATQQAQQAQAQLQQMDAQQQQADGMKAGAAMQKAQGDQLKTQLGAMQAERRDQIDAFKAETDRLALSKPDTTNVNVM